MEDENEKMLGRVSRWINKCMDASTHSPFL